MICWVRPSRRNPLFGRLKECALAQPKGDVVSVSVMEKLNTALTPEAQRAARGLLNWGVRDLAAAAGVAWTTVSQFENGRPMRSGTLPRSSRLSRLKALISWPITRRRALFSFTLGAGDEDSQMKALLPLVRDELFVFKSGPLAGWYFSHPHLVSTAKVLRHNFSRPNSRSGRGLKRPLCYASIEATYPTGKTEILNDLELRLVVDWASIDQKVKAKGLDEAQKLAALLQVKSLEASFQQIGKEIETELAYSVGEDSATAAAKRAKMLSLISKLARIVQEITRAEIEGVQTSHDIGFVETAADKRKADKQSRRAAIIRMVKDVIQPERPTLKRPAKLAAEYCRLRDDYEAAWKKDERLAAHAAAAGNAPPKKTAALPKPGYGFVPAKGADGQPLAGEKTVVRWIKEAAETGELTGIQLNKKPAP